jgi:hypothetical protein
VAEADTVAGSLIGHVQFDGDEVVGALLLEEIADRTSAQVRHKIFAS